MKPKYQKDPKTNNIIKVRVKVVFQILLYSRDPDTMVDPSGDIATELTK